MNIEDISKVTVILRGYNYDQVRTVCKVLVGSKINCVEITTNSPDVFETVRKIRDEFNRDLYIGVGTVLNEEHLNKAIQSNAQFILSPITLEKRLIEKCKEEEIIVVPSGLTPTEIYEQYQYGADIVKVFPANNVSMSFFKDIQGPLGTIPLMAVGGVNKKNCVEFLKNGAQYVGISSAMFNKVDIIEKNEKELRKSLKEFESEIDSYESNH